MHRVNTRGEWPFEQPSNYVRINFLICDLEFSFFRLLSVRQMWNWREFAKFHGNRWEWLFQKDILPIELRHCLGKISGMGV